MIYILHPTHVRNKQNSSNHNNTFEVLLLPYNYSSIPLPRKLANMVTSRHTAGCVNKALTGSL